jgi:hypothetical protein
MDISVRWRGEQDLYKSLIRIERKLNEKTSDFLKFSAEWLKNDIRSHWSSRSPSAPNSAPAVVSGNLDSSIFVEQQGRSLGGQFSSGAMTWFVRVDTAKGSNPRNRGGYSQALEFGVPSHNQRPRPFMQPAIDRLKQNFESLAKSKIKL